MSNHNHTKKLTLKRQSLRELTGAQMQQVAGGMSATCFACPRGGSEATVMGVRRY